MTELTPQQEAEKLLKQIIKGKEVHEQFEIYFKQQITISGQTIDYWNNRFKMDFPSNGLTLHEVQSIAAKLMNKWQDASFYYSIAQAKVGLMKRGSQSNYLSKFASIVEEHKSNGKRIPAANTLDTLAKIDGDVAESATILAETEMKFWKETLSRLDIFRKLLENATMSITSELKYLQTEKFLDGAEKKYNKGTY